MRHFLVLFLTLTSLYGQAAVVEKTIASVGEDVITKTELRLLNKQIRRGLFPNSLLFKYFNKNKILKNNKVLLDFIATQKALFKQSAGLEIPGLSRQISSTIKKIRGKASHKAFVKKINSCGLSYEKFKMQVEMIVRNDFLISEQVLPRVSISEHDVDSYYFNKYGRRLFKSFQFEFWYVQLKNSKAGKNRASKFLSKTSASSFKKVAQEMGLKTTTSQLRDTEINKIMLKHLKKLSVSQISPPIPVGRQLLILQLNWKQPYLNASQQKTKASIEKTLFERDLKKEMAKWVEEQKKHFFVRMHFH